MELKHERHGTTRHGNLKIQLKHSAVDLNLYWLEDAPLMT